jgi:signal peptidase I
MGRCATYTPLGMETQGLENYEEQNPEELLPHKPRRRFRWWIVLLPFMLVFVLASIRYLFFEVYMIPTPSCANTLMPGDYILVSKLSYGPRLPITPVAIPFYHSFIPGTYIKSYSSSITLPYMRLPGGKPHRGDLMVFNNPMGDSVIMEMPNSTFHDFMMNACEKYKVDESEFYKTLLPQFTLITHPVDRRENYIKRCVALPGDLISVSKSQLMVNGQLQPYPLEGLRLYYVYLRKNSLDDLPSLKQYELESLNNMLEIHDATILLLRMEVSDVQKLSSLKGIDSIVPYAELPNTRNYTNGIFPYNEAVFNWNADNYGPLYLPRKGDVVLLDDSTYSLYSRAIVVYENNKVEKVNGHFIINGKPAATYTFKMDYYWLMGDNRHNSLDSRFWGYVPEDHIIGKAEWVLFSKDPATSDWRFGRYFKQIK